MAGPQLTELEFSAYDRLEKAMAWVIRYGIAVVRVRGGAFLASKLSEKFKVGQYSQPLIDRQDTFALFMIRARGYYYAIEVLHRQEIDGTLFKYWVVHASTPNRDSNDDTPLHHCRFFVTEAKEDGSRVIVKRAEQYFPSYLTASGAQLVVPEIDLRVLYGLKAWQYPGCFPDSALPQHEVVVDERRGYQVVPRGLN